MIVINQKEKRKSEINTQISEKQAYLNSTDWITSKYNDEVTVLATSSKADFVAKYQDIYTARTQARNDINTLQAELESL